MHYTFCPRYSRFCPSSSMTQWWHKDYALIKHFVCFYYWTDSFMACLYAVLSATLVTLGLIFIPRTWTSAFGVTSFITSKKGKRYWRAVRERLHVKNGQKVAMHPWYAYSHLSSALWWQSTSMVIVSETVKWQEQKVWLYTLVFPLH